MATRTVATAAARRLGRLKAEHTAFFLCDIQERFRTGIYGFESLAKAADKMSRFSDIAGIPLIVTEQYPKGLGKTAKEISIGHAALVDEKTKFSMLTPAVAEKLHELGTQSVVLYGIESHVCVLQTCLELLEHEYDVHVLADVVSSMNAPEIDIALARMARAGAHIASSESVMFQLMGDAKHPKFKEVSNLVKEFQESARQNVLLFK